MTIVTVIQRYQLTWPWTHHYCISAGRRCFIRIVFMTYFRKRTDRQCLSQSRYINVITLIFWRPFVKRFAVCLCYRTVVLSCPVCLCCLSITLVYYGQTVWWIKMKLGMELGLVPGHIVLDADPAPSPKGYSPLRNFRPMSVVAKRLARSRCHLV